MAHFKGAPARTRAAWNVSRCKQPFPTLDCKQPTDTLDCHHQFLQQADSSLKNSSQGIKTCDPSQQHAQPAWGKRPVSLPGSHPTSTPLLFGELLLDHSHEHKKRRGACGQPTKTFQGRDQAKDSMSSPQLFQNGNWQRHVYSRPILPQKPSPSKGSFSTNDALSTCRAVNLLTGALCSKAAA